jgi:hypothetical protein
MILPKQYLEHINTNMVVISSKTTLKSNVNCLIELEYKWYIDIFNTLIQFSKQILVVNGNKNDIRLMKDYLYALTKQFYSRNDNYIKLMKQCKRYSECTYYISGFKEHLAGVIDNLTNGIIHILQKKLIFNVNKSDMQVLIKKILLCYTLYLNIK